jgi:hypothetical protein
MAPPLSGDLFFKLSPELRNLIYRELLDSENKVTNPITNSSTSAFALFRTSRYIHAEMSTFYFATGQFVANICSCGAPTPYIFPSVPDRYLGLIKHFHIKLRTGCGLFPAVQETAKKLTRLASVAERLEDVSITIRAAEGLSSVLNSRMDDSVMDVSHPITVALRHMLDTKASRIVHLRLENAWFATGVAAELQADFGHRLRILPVDDDGNSSATTSARSYERDLTGYSSISVLQNLMLPATDTDQDGLSSSPFLDASSNTSLGPDPDLVEPSMNTRFDNQEEYDIYLDPCMITDFDNDGDDDSKLTVDTEGKDVTVSDDINIDEDLLPIDQDEVEAMATAWEASEDDDSDYVMTGINIKFLVILAPQCL